jgi:hypothetical protein
MIIARHTQQICLAAGISLAETFDHAALDDCSASSALAVGVQAAIRLGDSLLETRERALRKSIKLRCCEARERDQRGYREELHVVNV